MNNMSPPQYFSRDAEGITTAYNVGFKTGSVSYSPAYSGGLILSSTRLGTQGFISFDPVTAPASTEGYLYYDSALHKLRIRGAAGFETITSV